jgi:hypothetical protein
MKTKTYTTQFLISAAVAGIIGAGALGSLSSARAEEGTTEAKGHCMGANGCKGQGGCAQAKTAHAKANECAGKNGCKGKGFIETTKADCDAMMAKDKKIHFEAKKS